MEIIHNIVRIILLVLFAVDYFMYSPTATDKLTTCVFWTVLVLFGIYQIVLSKKYEK